MTMRDQEPLHASARDRATNHNAPWILVAIAFLGVLGITAYALTGSKTAVVGTQTDPPAVIAAPAPASGVPAPTPETTTGQAPAASTQSQPAPQGPISTGSSEGAAAATPQGETPPGMQAVPK